MWLVLLVWLAVGAGVFGQGCTPKSEYTVKTQQGSVRGCELTTREGKPIAAFRGIRYAKPPTGELRFAAPKPADSWTGVQDVIQDAPSCIQKNYLLPNVPILGEEDCLFLNVYTPQTKLTNTNETPLLPVMVYIHGGGWFAGSGASIFNGPEYLLDNNVILVTMNYRLASLGFLSSGDDVAPGNWGLKDQTLALKWVQDNIDKFGGNPNSVTIFGQSAGGASVHYLMLSTTTKGLFHKAISQSGTTLNLWATPKNSAQILKKQGEFLNCTQENAQDLIDCIRKVDARTLVESGDKFKLWDVDPLTVYVPSVEKQTEKNPEPFLEDLPVNLVKNGKFHHIPFMLGIMKNEGIIRAASLVSKSKLRESLNECWEHLGPELFALSQSVPKNQVPNLWNNMTDFYMGSDNYIDENSSKSIQNFIDMYSDRGFIYGTYQTAKAHAKYAPVYFYKMDYAGLYSYAQIFVGTNETVNYKFSASHCDELIFLFRAPALFPDFPEDSTDTKLSKIMVEMWTNFAKTGIPNEQKWTTLKKSGDKFPFFNIGQEKNGNYELKMKYSFLPERMQFWEKLDLVENKVDSC